MKQIKKTLIILFALILTLTAPFSSYEAAAAQKEPALNAKVTAQNIQALLKKYDPDGACIMQKQIAKGDDICVWFSGQDRIIDSIDTAVHEETHGYSFYYAKNYNQTAYFVGNKKTVHVTHTKVYRSKTMAGSIPKNLRTFRYNIYVAKPRANLASDVQGAYGLLNEFMAYVEKQGYTLEITNENIMLRSGRSGTGVGRFTADYRKLCNEIGKKKYNSIHRALVKKGA